MKNPIPSQGPVVGIAAIFFFLLICFLAGRADAGNETDETPPKYDIVLSGGLIYDGSGESPYAADIGVNGDRIDYIGDIDADQAATVIDASGMAVSPGFINMLSWAVESLIVDGRGMSDIVQGVTLEVFGEGVSMGPWTPIMKETALARQTDIKYEIEWTTLGEYLDYMEMRGVSPNIASFVGATTLREKHLGFEDRAPTPQELKAMQDDAVFAMEEGALGVASALIYPPAFFARTDELIALTEVVAEYGGSYITHMRSEGGGLLQSVDEVIEIAKATGAGAEIYHLKASGEDNWEKMDEVIKKINAARKAGLKVRANMYAYPAASTGLSATMPPWVQEGGHDAWIERLKDPEIRARVIKEMNTPTDEWENLFLDAGGPENVLIIGLRNPALKSLTGKTLEEVAQARGTSPAATIIDLVIEDDSRVEAVYFLMTEENIKKQMRQPWVSFQSDAPALAPEGVFLESSMHPRAYGNFARVLARYVRDEGVISLQEAVRKMTSLPADNLKIQDRGRLKEGYFADIVVFDPETIQDNATFTNPHQLATGVDHVLVNGVPVLRNGEHTGATPGRVVRGPGYKPAGD